MDWSPKAPETVNREPFSVEQLKAILDAFHSFRVTWIALALAAGVPSELEQRVTGHRTAVVVLKH